MHFPSNKYDIWYTSIPIPYQTDITPASYILLDFIHIKHFFDDKKLMVKFPILWLPYIMQICYNVDGALSNNQNTYYTIIFKTSNNFDKSIITCDINSIKTLILNFYWRNTDISDNTWIELVFDIQNEEYNYILATKFFYFFFTSDDYDPITDF